MTVKEAKAIHRKIDELTRAAAHLRRGDPLRIQMTGDIRELQFLLHVRSTVESIDERRKRTA